MKRVILVSFDCLPVQTKKWKINNFKHLLETPGYTLSFRVNVCSSEHHSTLPFGYRFMSLLNGLGTFTTYFLNTQNDSKMHSKTESILYFKKKHKKDEIKCFVKAWKSQLIWKKKKKKKWTSQLLFQIIETDYPGPSVIQPPLYILLSLSVLFYLCAAVGYPSRDVGTWQ